jgi:hypothetical protein
MSLVPERFGVGEHSSLGRGCSSFADLQCAPPLAGVVLPFSSGLAAKWTLPKPRRCCTAPSVLPWKRITAARCANVASAQRLVYMSCERRLALLFLRVLLDVAYARLLPPKHFASLVSMLGVAFGVVAPVVAVSCVRVHRSVSLCQVSPRLTISLPSTPSTT